MISRVWIALVCMGMFASLAYKDAHAANPAFKKVMIIIFENTRFEDTIGLPYFSKMAKQGGLLDNLHAETHPSQPNYVALISGSTHGVSNNPVTLDKRHIGNLLEAHGKHWKTYAEAYPGNCFLDYQSETYVRRHNPFLSFKDVQENPKECALVVNANQLKSDIEKGALADYSLYIPDLKNDGHDTGPIYADRWLARTFDSLFHDRRLMKDMLIILTFDEGAGNDPTNHIYTLLYGDSVVPGSVSTKQYSHYSLLRTIEDTFQIGDLGEGDARAPAITDVWK